MRTDANAVISSGRSRSSPLRRRLVRISATAAAAGGLLALCAAPAGAAFPGTNGRVVFSSNRPAADGSTDFEIYSIEPDGTGLLQLTDNVDLPPSTEGGGSGSGSGGSGSGSGEGEGEVPSPTPIDDVQPAVSPDGRQIAFVSNRPAPDGSTDTEIYVMNTDGSDVRQVTNVGSGPPSTNAEHEPAWSPDGRQIVFRRGEGAKADLWVVDLASGRETRLLTAYESGPAGYDAQPAWSPDGSRIAFRKGSGKSADIWIYDLYGPRQGESLPVIHAVGVAESNPSWSPNGREIAYARGDDGAGAGIWVARADGSGQHALTGPQPDAEGKLYSDLAPRFSPDGRRIVFQSTRDGILKPPEEETSEEQHSGGMGSGGHEEEAEISGAVELFTMGVDGSDLTRLTTAADLNGPADLNPDWQTIPLPAPPPEVPTQQQLKAPVVEVPLVSEGTERCVPLRSFKVTIRLTKLDRRHMRYVHARVNGRRVRVRVKGRHVNVGVDAKRAVKGRLTIEVYVMLRHGNHLWAMRTFHRCDGRRLDGVKTFHLQRHGPHRVRAAEHR